MRFLTFLAFLTFAATASAQVSGIGYRLSPAATYVFPDADAGLSNGFEYGGAIGFSLGEFVELGGLYTRSTGFATDFSGFDDLPTALAGIAPRDVALQRYGGELKLNLLRTGLAPYVTTGAGVIRFDPDGLAASRNVYLAGGGGVQLTGADRFALSVGGSVLTYRYNPGSTFLSDDELAGIPLDRADIGQRTVLSPFAKASIQVYLGGRRPGQLSDIDRAYIAQFGSGLSGLSVQIAPTVAYVDFSDRFGYRPTGFAGGEVGFDFGPLVGLRGFYLRGVSEDDPTDIQEIQAYGGLGRFRLSDGSGLVPVLTLGGGYLDVLDGYVPRDGAAVPEGRPFALGGVGLEIPAFSRLRITGEARALAMSTADESDISSPEEVYISPMYRVGVSFGLGGSAGRRVDVVRRDEAEAQLRAELAQQQAELDSLNALRMERQEQILIAQRDSVVAERDSALAASQQRYEAELAEARSTAASRASAYLARIEQAEARGDSLQAATLRAEAEANAEADAQRLRALELEAAIERGEIQLEAATAGETVEVEDIEIREARTITLPIPRVGELYVRYGDPTGTRLLVDGDPQAAGRSDAEIRRMAREAIRAALQAEAVGDSTMTDDERAARIEAALNLALDRADTPSTTVALPEAQIRAIEERLERRFMDEIRALRRDLGLGSADSSREAVPSDPSPTLPVQTAPAETPPPAGQDR